MPKAMPEMPGDLDLLRAYLRDRDVVCPVCRHNLRSAAGFACPECGGRLDLRVVSMDTPHTWWIACVLAFALPLGLFASVAAAGTYGLIHARLSPTDRIMYGACCGVTLMGIVNTIVLCRGRTRFLQRPLWRQRVRAAVSWAVMLMLALVLIFAMGRAPYEWPWTLLNREPMP
jgi:hypothetical protein